MNLIQADILDWAATYQGEPFHAALLDAPYELREIDQAELDLILGEMDYETGAKGFMGRRWDGTGLVFRPALWRAIAQHLLPGAFIFVFGGTLNDDLISLAMRRAGLRRFHKALAWVNLSGFPKATRIDVALDKAAGAEREIVGQRQHAPKFAAKDFGYREKDNGYNSRDRESFDVTAPATPEAAAWQGHRYGLQALKPAADPILIFQKPYAGRPVDSIARTGAGALNIAEARIGTSKRVPGSLSTQNGGALGHLAGLGIKSPDHIGQNPDIGRWPSNLCLVHHPACNGTCHEQCPVRRLGEQSGERPAKRGADASGNAIYGTPIRTHNATSPNDTGTAARMFLNADWMHERLEAADPAFYASKASTAEREAGLDGFDPTTVGDGRQTPIDNAYQRGETSRRNPHPTVKNIALTKWLATLLLPPVEYAPRRLLVPFAGVGSEILGAHLAGWEQIVGVEREAEYVAIARARLDWWQTAARRLMTTDPEAILDHQELAGERTLFDLL